MLVDRIAALGFVLVVFAAVAGLVAERSLGPGYISFSF